MSTAQPTLFSRSDTIFGACEGLGQDFGFNAQYLRVALAAILFWSPVAAVAAYMTIAVAVFISRCLYPAASGVVIGMPASKVVSGERASAAIELAAAA